MSDSDVEDALLDAARYLRGVRPLDPEELREYVPEDVDRATVASILAENAVALGLRERPDGTFVPVRDETAAPDFSGVAALPDRITAAIEACLIDAYGPNWYAEDSGDRLREAIQAFKSAYLANADVTYDRDAALGYAIYHLPGTYAKSQYLLDLLARHGRLPACLQVLEVGPGVGGVALGLADYLGPRWPVEYLGIEASEAATAIAARLLDDTHRNFRWEFERSKVESVDLSGSYDLVVCANVLGELGDPTAVAHRLVDAVGESGSLLLLEPADERTSRLLRTVERELVADRESLDVFAPTLRLWPNHTPTDDCWSFDRRPPIDVPRFQRALDEGPSARTDERDPATGEFVNVDIRYTYAVLGREGERVSSYRPSRAAFAPLATSDEHVGGRINLAVVKLSHSLSEPDRHPLYVIGDGSQSVEHFAVRAKGTSLNAAVDAADYGDILEIEGGLVLWNEDQEAYNVVIDDETVVERVPVMSERPS